MPCKIHMKVPVNSISHSKIKFLLVFIYLTGCLTSYKYQYIYNDNEKFLQGKNLLLTKLFGLKMPTNRMLTLHKVMWVFTKHKGSGTQKNWKLTFCLDREWQSSFLPNACQKLSILLLLRLVQQLPGIKKSKVSHIHTPNHS